MAVVGPAAATDAASTQRNLPAGIVAELAAAGFGDAEEIGRGGFGVVYRCYEYALERQVAVKVLMSEIHGEAREQFVREQHALGRLSGHPYILQVLQVDITPTGRPYIVTPYYAQGSLDRVLHAVGPLRWPEVLSIGVKMSGALAAAHALGIVHRDLKPGNVLLTDYGEPQLADFGIAQLGDAITMAGGTIAGTPAFTAPEVLGGGAPSPAADIYSLGATMFTLLTGHPAFARRSGEPLEVQLARIASGRRPALTTPGIPEAVRAAVDTAMATDPGERPPAAADFGELLREVQRDCGVAVDVLALPLTSVESETATPALVLPTRAGGLTPPPPPMAATKFRPPASNRTSIGRPRLLNLLAEGGRRRLRVIHGPAGFGKTTLAAQWARWVDAQGIPVAWLTADTDDDNVLWFLTHLVEAIRRVRPELARDLGTLLEERASDATRSVLSALIDEIHDSGQGMALVVDDWQRVSGRSTIAALDFMLEHGCHHLAVVVVGRTMAGLPLARMMINDELVEIDATALRFTLEEATEFLVDRNKLPLRSEDVRRLQNSVEGWPAALQLASLYLRGRSDPGAVIATLTGRHKVIAEYLTDNVLAALDPALLDFLKTTSISTRIRADLAAVLSGRADSQQLLEEVADRNLFLQRLDDEGEWFRYNRLFADHLRRRLMAEDPDRVTRLHERAATWFADHDLLTGAVDHALASGDPQRATDLVEQRSTALVAGKSPSEYLTVLAKLPGSLTESRPRLQLSAAWAELSRQRPEAVHRALHHVQMTLATGSVPEPEATRFAVEAEMVSAIEQYFTDRLERLPPLLTAHLEDGGSPFLALAAANLAAIDAVNHFDFDAAVRWQLWGARYRDTGGQLVVMHGRCVAGLAALDQLEISEAEQLFEGAVSAARQSAVRARPAALAGTLLADLRYRQGLLAEAGELFDAVSRLDSSVVAVDFQAAVFGTGARLAALRGDRDHAVLLLDTGARIAERGALVRLAARMTDERLRLGLPIPAATRDRLRKLPYYRKQDNRIRAITAELEQNSTIALLRADGTPAALAEACVRAERMVHEITAQPRPLALTEARLRSACCLWAAGRHHEAAEMARAPLALCRELGIGQFAADAGPETAELFAVLP